MGWQGHPMRSSSVTLGRLVSYHERNALVALAAERFRDADRELAAADGAWPDAMARTALLDVDEADLARIQERNRVALVEWQAAKAALIEAVDR